MHRLPDRSALGRVDFRCQIAEKPPRFTARVVYTAPGGEAAMPGEGPANILSGTTYVANGGDVEGDVLLCEIAWTDEPSPGEVTQLMEAAADAWEAWEEKYDQL